MRAFDSATRAIADRESQPTERDPPTGETAQAADQRQITVEAGGETVTVERPDTQQPDDEGSWLSGTKSYGRPRGIDALEHRQIVQTSAMQSIVNGIAGQVLGGELTFETNDDVMDSLSPQQQEAAERLKVLLRDILTGPHLPDRSLDQLMTAAIEDMVGPGQAVWQLLPAESADIPVVMMQTLDPLTIRINIDRHNVFGDPPYWQATGAFSGGSVAGIGNVDPTPLQHDDVAIMDYPYGTRSYHTYPISPSWQVREWLEILANSTTHHNRFYSDNDIPPGLLTYMEQGAGTTATDIKEQLEAAKGDPRDVPVVEGSYQWLDLGGTAVNLNIIEEQKWFFQMCLGALGLGKAEVGLIEDVNRSNGEVEATRIYKRVGGPFTDQFEEAMLKVCRQFDLFTELGEPFRPRISYSDPREERAREERLRQQLQAGAITPRQYARRTGDDDIAADDDRWQVDIAGETVNYGDHPMWVAQRLMSAAAGDGVDVDGEPDMVPGAGGESETDGGNGGE